MRRPGADSVFNEELAREVAEREGLPLVLAVQVDREEDGYRLQARLVRAASGDPARTLTARAGSPDEVIAALGDLLQRTRRALGESSASLAANSPSLPRVTTPSLEALRAYLQAQRVDSAALLFGNIGEEYGRTLYRAGDTAAARALHLAEQVAEESVLASLAAELVALWLPGRQ